MGPVQLNIYEAILTWILNYVLEDLSMIFLNSFEIDKKKLITSVTLITSSPTMILYFGDMLILAGWNN